MPGKVSNKPPLDFLVNVLLSVADVPETQISLQFSGELHLYSDKEIHRFSYLMMPSFGKISKKANKAWTLDGMNWREG